MNESPEMNWGSSYWLRIHRDPEQVKTVEDERFSIQHVVNHYPHVWFLVHLFVCLFACLNLQSDWLEG